MAIWYDADGTVSCDNAVIVHDLDNQDAVVRSIVPMASGDYLIAGDYAGGTVTNRSMFVMMINKDGSKLWRTNFSDRDQGHATEVVDSTNSLSIYAVGRDSSKLEEKFFLVRLDQNGNVWSGWPVEWNGGNSATGGEVDNFPAAILPNPAKVGGMLIVGWSTPIGEVEPKSNTYGPENTILFAYEPDGTLYWSRRFQISNGSFGDQPDDAVIGPDGDLVLVGSGSVANSAGKYLQAGIAAKFAVPTK